MASGGDLKCLSSECVSAPSKVPVLKSDHGLIVAGVVTAIGSAVFAAFMISQDNRQDMFKGDQILGVFAQALRARSHQTKFHDDNQNRWPIYSRTIDYNVTGSISMSSAGRSVQNTNLTPNIERNAVSTSAREYNSYILRFVHNDAALLLSAHGFYVAKQGTILPGVGKVLSIEKVNNKWVLVTATHVFTEVIDNIR